MQPSENELWAFPNHMSSDVCIVSRRVADVMTESPIVVRPTTDMTSAARLLLDTKVGRRYCGALLACPTAAPQTCWHRL